MQINKILKDNHVLCDNPQLHHLDHKNTFPYHVCQRMLGLSGAELDFGYLDWLFIKSQDVSGYLDTLVLVTYNWNG